jgi:hypothetical protein
MRCASSKSSLGGEHIGGIDCGYQYGCFRRFSNGYFGAVVRQ